MKTFHLNEKRKSTRVYKAKSLSDSDRFHLHEELLKKAIAAPESSISFFWIEDGFEAAKKLEGLAGYFGKMIHAPHYYAVLAEPNKSSYKLAGYEGESLILRAIEKGMGACWIEVHNSDAVKKVLEISVKREIAALIAIGYGKKAFQRSSLFRSNSLSTLTDLGYPNINPLTDTGPTRESKPITDFVYHKSWGQKLSLEDLEALGLHEAFFYMRLAPSYANKQPWHFLIHETHIDLFFVENAEISPALKGLDAGIAMFYFETGLHHSGLKGYWDLALSPKSSTDHPQGFEFIASYVF